MKWFLTVFVFKHHNNPSSNTQKVHEAKQNGVSDFPLSFLFGELICVDRDVTALPLEVFNVSNGDFVVSDVISDVSLIDFRNGWRRSMHI